MAETDAPAEEEPAAGAAATTGAEVAAGAAGRARNKLLSME